MYNLMALWLSHQLPPTQKLSVSSESTKNYCRHSPVCYNPPPGQCTPELLTHDVLYSVSMLMRLLPPWNMAFKKSWICIPRLWSFILGSRINTLFSCEVKAAFAQTLAMAEQGLGWTNDSKKLLSELGVLLNAHSWQPACQLVLPVTFRACLLSTEPQHLPISRNKGLWTFDKIIVDKFTVTKKKT